MDHIEENQANDAKNEKESKKKLFWHEVWDWVRTIAFTVLFTLLFQQFVFTLARVDGPSMLDTLHTDQLMAVLRVHYYFVKPERGEVVLCRYPNYTEDCVKRVIGLPGETISAKNGMIYINGEALDEPYLSRPDMYDFDEVVVPENSYFVVGDNRWVSQDSRAVGSLPRNQIKGQCFAVIYPFNEIGAIPTK